MIQCETCKVWQHCPCVGLGNGEVTPDKYYCDSCRPQNHPYKVQNGMLISNSKRAPQLSSAASALKTKSPKKRNTMNSKETSIPIELLAQTWDEDTTHESADDSRGSKRRRKTESTSDDDDEGDFHNNTHSQDEDDNRIRNDNNNGNSNSTSISDSISSSNCSSNCNGNNNNKGDEVENDQDSEKAYSYHNSPSTHPSKKSSSTNTRTYKHKKSASKANNADHPSSTASGPEQEDTSRYQHASGSKNGRPTDQDIDGHPVVPSTKRRKTAKPDSWPRDDSLPPEDGEYTGSSTKKDANGERSDSRSKKNGTGSRSSKRQSGSDHDNEDSNTLDSSFHPVSTRSSSHVQSPAVIPKKSFSRRHHRGSRNSTPVPGDGEGTPQPMAPVQPAAVRYPSAKMTMQDMTKRAKQLLDYIARVQVDMADRKNKLASPPTPPKGVSKMVPDKDSQTPTPTKDSIHEDNQVCPNSARSSIDGTMDGPSDLKALDSKGGEMDSLALTELDSKLLSTSSEHLDSKLPIMNAFALGGALHIPATPSPPPQEVDDSSLVPMSGTSVKVSDESGKTKELIPEKPFTSLEMMDKLSGDLIRFQERFGSHT
ncbi:hypothetical protein BGZ59_006219 [Podila verticillata]|nr:hypothetical protein BGZ59_006219 [Podila verticillata]